MERIYVVYTPIEVGQGSGFEIPAYHKDIYYEGDDGTNQMIRGQTSVTLEGTQDFRNWSLVAKEIANPDLSENGLRDREAGREIMAEGSDLSQQWTALTGEMGRLDDLDYPYNPLYRNSNWLADRGFLAAGLALPQNDTFASFWSPGSITPFSGTDPSFGIGLSPQIQPDFTLSDRVGAFIGAIEEAVLSFITAPVAMLFDALNASGNGPERTAASGLDVVHLRANGSIDAYINGNGDTVVLADDSYYTGSMLRNYGTEFVNNGQLEGGMTFGATLRAFGDWLGLDGTPGLDGGFANDDEGSAAAGPGTGGAGGDSGSTSSGNDDNDGPKGIQSSPASGGPKPPPQPGGNPHPKPTPGPVDIDTPKGPKVLHPILLDLDGNGIQLTDLTRSTVFMEGQEGLKHRTAWAGAGDGVLFYDTDGDNAISDVREYVFTEWDPTAKDDLAALRSRFDANGDGRLTGTELTGFKVMRTNPDGSLTAVTLASLNITQINLKQDATRLVSTHEYKKFGSSIGLIVP